jgi:predicted ATPase
MSVEQIAERLDDRFLLLTGGSRTSLPRQQTLRASIDWSYSLLNETEQRLFQGLSIFSGGWSLEAAEAIWSFINPGRFEILEILNSLVNKSLVLVNFRPEIEPRYDMLETIRQYAREKLTKEALAETCNEAAIRDYHLNYYLHFAERIQSELKTERRFVVLGLLEAELDNFRAALRWSLKDSSAGNSEKGLRLATALGDFWTGDNLLNAGLT